MPARTNRPAGSRGLENNGRYCSASKLGSSWFDGLKLKVLDSGVFCHRKSFHLKNRSNFLPDLCEIGCVSGPPRINAYLAARCRDTCRFLHGKAIIRSQRIMREELEMNFCKM